MGVGVAGLAEVCKFVSEMMGMREEFCAGAVVLFARLGERWFHRFPNFLVDHKHLFRCSRTEVDRLLNMIALHAAFIPTGKRPQAPPPLQLAVFLNRMAHGGDVQSSASRFDVCSTPTTIGRQSN